MSVNQVDLRSLFEKTFKPFHFNDLTQGLLERISHGSEKADDYEEIIRQDAFFTEKICAAASSNMKSSVVSSLGHAVVLIGLQRVRNGVLGHSLLRNFDSKADGDFQDLQQSEKVLKYCLLAEEHARKCKNEYVGLAYIAGFAFDVLSQAVRKEEKWGSLEAHFEFLWKHSLRSATLAWALASHERVFIAHRKIIFAAGLLHDIGKLVLCLYDYEKYFPVLEEMKSQRDVNQNDDSYEAAIEKKYFDLTHAEVGSMLVHNIGILRELEMEIDFHHDSTLLRTRNPDAFLGVATLNIADRLAWLMDRKPSFEQEDLQEILKAHAQYFPLKSSDLMDLFAKTRSAGLLL
ncbi:MAG: HDOD domain-containing protein [Oligoflexia bacterium]|nr:HDOD domain-containing protein [Oligoflexia bacterium]